MRFLVDQQTLARALRASVQGCFPRANLPILSHVLITTHINGAGVTLFTTDLETSVRVFVPAQVIEPGQAALNCDILCQMVAAMAYKRRKREADELAQEAEPVDTVPTEEELKARPAKTAQVQFQSNPLDWTNVRVGCEKLVYELVALHPDDFPARVP